MQRYSVTVDGQEVILNTGMPFTLNGIQYPSNFLENTTKEKLALMGIVLLGAEQYVSEPVNLSVSYVCALIDAERDRRLSRNYSHDFGETAAQDDYGNSFAAGFRNLQMRPEDRTNWQTLQGAALTAVIGGQPDLIMPMRADDNCNIMTTAIQVLGILAAMTAYGSRILFHGGALKGQTRVAEDLAAINIYEGWPE